MTEDDETEAKSLFDKFVSLVKGSSNKEPEKENKDEPVNVSVEPIAKSVDVEKQLFTSVVLRPETVDAHGDIYSEDVVEKACHQYNTICRKSNLQHLVNTDLAEPVESYIAPTDFTLGNGEVKKSDWVLTMKIKDDDIWKMCKDGTFTGFSVGCPGKVEVLDG